MLRFFKRRSAIPTSSSQPPIQSKFEAAAATALKLRTEIVQSLKDTNVADRRATFDVVQRIASAGAAEYGIHQDTLLFGRRDKLPRERVILLLAMIKAFHEAVETKRDYAALTAVGYCQSMAILLLAGTEATGDQEETEFVLLKHAFGEQTDTIFLGLKR
jgi:hypothetical protein